MGGQDWTIGDLSHLDTPAPFIAMMPQWEFLDFLRGRGAKSAALRFGDGRAGRRLPRRADRVIGLRYASGRTERAGRLVIAADGRGSSLVRSLGMLPVEQLGAPMDVLWFKLPKSDDGGDALRGSIEPGRMVVLIDRDDYWQAAYLIPKGSEADVRARGLDWLRAQVGEAFPDVDLSGCLSGGGRRSEIA